MNKKFAKGFTKPSRGMSTKCESRTRVCRNRAFDSKCERFRLSRGAVASSGTKAAFTLAEVLITLAIVGVVAALTLPNLIANYQEKVTVNKLERMYSILSQANTMANLHEDILPETTGNSWEDSSNAVFNRFKAHLKIAKDCGFEDGCFPNVTYKKFNGSDALNFITNRIPRYMVRLNDGSAIAFVGYAYAMSPGYDQVAAEFRGFGGAYYDVNGDGAPNQFGVDIFQFNFNKYGIVPYNELAKLENTDYLDDCYTNGYYCSTWVLQHKNLNYRRCDKTVLLETNGTCKR